MGKPEKIINIHEAKTNLSKLIEGMLRGENIVIAKSGNPIARLIPYHETQKPRNLGRDQGKIWMSDDFNSSVDPETFEPIK